MLRRSVQTARSRSATGLRRLSAVTPPAAVAENAPAAPELARGHDPAHGSYHWVYERALSVATLGLVAGAAATSPYAPPALDFGLGVVLPLHCHAGLGAIITDYLPARKFPRTNRAAGAALGAATAGTMLGLYMYNTRDEGVCAGVRRVLYPHAAAED